LSGDGRASGSALGAATHALPADHFLPATYIARFSGDGGPTRRRRVFVLRTGASRPARQAAEGVARIRGHYDDRIAGPKLDLERSWQGYEAHLPKALRALTSGLPLDAQIWLRVLVPFVAAALLRGPDFDVRFKRRVDDFDAHGIISDAIVADTTIARVMELQRLLTVVMISGWVVLESPIDLICNDLGWTLSRSRGTDRIGFTMPLDSRHALLIVPTHARPLMRWVRDSWIAIVAQDTISAENAADLNQALFESSSDFIFGGSEEAVVRSRSGAGGHGRLTDEPLRLAGYDHRLIISHEFEWMRACAAADKRPEAVTSFDLEWDWVHAPGWAPPAVIFPSNLPEFPSGLSLQNHVIGLELAPVPGFTEPPYWPSHERNETWPNSPGSVAMGVMPERLE
jgi:hypothetical protein